MSLITHWDRQYRCARPAWETGRPSSELQRVLSEWHVRPCPAIDLGCGLGTNTIWLAEQGFPTLGVDVSRLAIQRAREHCIAEGVPARFLAADLLDFWKLGGPYQFFLDRGCYHSLHLYDSDGYLRTLESITEPGAVGLLLTGNADEPEEEAGPPVLEERELRDVFDGLFEILMLRPFRFDAFDETGRRYLGWSCLLRRRGD